MHKVMKMSACDTGLWKGITQPTRHRWLNYVRTCTHVCTRLNTLSPKQPLKAAVVKVM